MTTETHTSHSSDLRRGVILQIGLSTTTHAKYSGNGHYSAGLFSPNANLWKDINLHCLVSKPWNIKLSYIMMNS